MIWCVDDDSAIRDIEVYTLNATGFEAKGFADGVSMLHALSEEKPQLIILDIMMPGKSGLEVLREWTESIHHQIERLNSLVTQLLTLAKMEEGGGELELKTWNASETIMDAVTSFEASVVTKQIALQSDIAEEVHMEGDAARIHQLVSLLVDNAVKYTPEGGKIHIFWRKNGKKAEFSVQNTCDTLPEGDLNRLFGRFYRADASRARGKRRLWNRPFRGCCNCKGT